MSLQESTRYSSETVALPLETQKNSPHCPGYYHKVSLGLFCLKLLCLIPKWSRDMIVHGHLAVGPVASVPGGK